MTREAWTFQRALLVSLILHVLLLALFFTLPGGGPAEPVQIYTVRIMEAPARPEARALELSTDAISALKLESPSLSPDAPPLPQPAQEDVPDVERLPPDITSQTGLPPSAAPTTRQPAPSAAPAASSTLPQLPGLPPQAPPAVAPAAPNPEAQVLAPPQSLPDEEPTRPTALQQLGSKVRSLKLKVETAPPPGEQPTAVPGAERNVLSLRIYSNRVREAVKEQYTFPGVFDPSLRTRVRVELNRDGTVRSAEILEPSGNDRFDRLVCLAALNKAKIPPIPRGIAAERDSLTLYFTCSP